MSRLPPSPRILSPSMALVIIALSQFAIPFMFSGVGVTLPAMGADLDASAVALGLVETLFLAAGAAFLPPVGRWADLWGKAVVFRAGLFGFALTTLAIGAAPWSWLILALRFLQGAFSAMAAVTSMAILVEVIPAHRRGAAIGVVIGTIYAGLAAGPFLAGAITGALGWRWVYLLGFLPLIGSWLMALRLPDDRLRGRVDRSPQVGASLWMVAGASLSITGFGLLAHGWVGCSMLALGIFALIQCVRWERRSDDPLLPWGEIWSNRPLSRALGAQFLLYSVPVGAIFLFSIFLQAVQGMSPEAAGRVLVVPPILMALIAPLSGRFADRGSPKRLAVMGAALITLSPCIAFGVQADSGLARILAALIAQGVGFALFSSPNMAMILGAVAPERMNLASALAALMRSLGMVFSMAIVTLLISLNMGGETIQARPEAFAALMPTAFALFGLMGGASFSTLVERRG